MSEEKYIRCMGTFNYTVKGSDNDPINTTIDQQFPQSTNKNYKMINLAVAAAIDISQRENIDIRKIKLEFLDIDILANQ